MTDFPRISRASDFRHVRHVRRSCRMFPPGAHAIARAASVSLLCLFTLWSVCLSADTTRANTPPDMSLLGQLKSLTDELRDKMSKDPPLKNQKLAFGKVVNENLADSNFELRLETELRTRLADLLSDGAELTLSASYDYFEATDGDNKGHKIVQITLVIKDSKRVEKAKLVREINNTGDIARILGSTLAPPDVADFEARNQAGETARDKPQFAVHPQQATAVIAPGQLRYAVELRKRVRNEGTPVAVAPVSQKGQAFAEIGLGDTYQVVLLNFDNQFDAVAKLEIDGLDAANTFNADGVEYPGYFVPRAKDGKPGEHVVPGWLHTVKPGTTKPETTPDQPNVFQFVVNELGKGAASAKQVRSSIGVINVRFFDAAKPDEVMRPRTFGETGRGQGMRVDYALENVQIGSQPLSIISIRYTRSR